MKIYVIASTEYEANMPDLFLMDNDGNYYGVGKNSYARWQNFPKGIGHWMSAEGSDIDRRFNIEEVELPSDKVEEFDRITKEYAKLDDETPRFELFYPVLSEYKTKKAYQQAVDEFNEKHKEWCESSNIRHYMAAKDELWRQRTTLFCTFSQKVYDAISDNDYIKRYNS